MPANTIIKLRAGTNAEWTAAGKTQSLSAAAISGTGVNTVVRYTASGHTLQVDDIVTITGFGVSSGSNPYNIAGGVISAVASGTFDVSVAAGTTGGTSTGTGTAKLILLSNGESGFITDANGLKIGDGVTSWETLPYPNQPMYLHVGTQETIAGTTNEQDLFDRKLALTASTVYQFQIQGTINGIDNATGLQFGFLQTDMTAWTYARYHWVIGDRAESDTVYYAASSDTFVGSNAGTANSTSSLVNLVPSGAVNDVVFFTITGTIRTGAGASDFRPRIKFTAAPGTGLNLLAGAYATIQPLGPSNIDYVGNWVAN